MGSKSIRRVLLVILYSLLIVIAFLIYQEFRLVNVWNDVTVPPTYSASSNEYVVKDQVSDDILTREEALDDYVNEPIGTIYIPRVGMEVTIIEGASNADADMQVAMKYTAGHEPESYLPGEGHQIVIPGHREEQFSALKDVKEGDIVVVDILDNTFLYKVDEMKVVSPEGSEAVEYVRGETDEETLVLYTCYPFQPLTPVTGRYVVKAKRIDEVTLTPEQAKKVIKKQTGEDIDITKEDNTESDNSESESIE